MPNELLKIRIDALRARLVEITPSRMISLEARKAILAVGRARQRAFREKGHDVTYCIAALLDRALEELEKCPTQEQGMLELQDLLHEAKTSPTPDTEKKLKSFLDRFEHLGELALRLS